MQNDQGTKTPEAEAKAGRIIRAPDFLSFYANAARVATSFADTRIYFYESVPEQPLGLEVVPETTKVQHWIERACIVVTPEYLKILAKALTKAVDTYQSTFGLIREKPPEES